MQEYCAHLSSASYVSVDTEFMRERSYWPKFCLVQLAPPQAWINSAQDWLDQPALIDPLAEGIDLNPFFNLLTNHKILKLFHASRQDLELFFHLLNAMPAPIYDTQLAASVCGFGDQIAYGALAYQLIGKEVDKSARLTDWALRPLSKKAADYAVSDVLYLGAIYEKLRDKIAKLGRESWLDEELAILTNPETYRMDPEQAINRIKRQSVNRKAYPLLKRLAHWREETAQTKDIPRQHILRDEALIDIAAHAPKDKQGLERLRSISKGFGNSAYGRALLAEIEKERQDPQPMRVEPSKPVNTAAHKSRSEMMRLLLKLIAANHGVAARLIATSDDLDALARDDQADILAMKGWRYRIFGQFALKLKYGKLLIGLDADGKIIFKEQA